MARIKARIKPRPVVAQSRSDAKLKRAEARALAAEAEEREFARKEAAEDDALLATQQRVEEEKMARKAEEKRRGTKELFGQHFKNMSDLKARQQKINDEHMHTATQKLEKLFEDQKEEARVQKVVDDAAEKFAVNHLNAFTTAVNGRINAFTSKLDDLRTTRDGEARDRQEAASKKESAYKDAVDAINRSSLEWTEQHAKLCAEEDNIQDRLLEEKQKLLEQQEEFSESDSEDEV
jgi:hypothetical protein